MASGISGENAGKAAEKERKIRRIWVPQVAVDVETLAARVAVARARRLDPAGEAVAKGVEFHLDRARAAAFRKDPLPRRLANWWRGTLVEMAFRHLHAAQAQIVDLYDEEELRAEIPVAVARAQTALNREDPRQLTMEGLAGCPPGMLRHQLRHAASDSYAATDAKHGQLRSFRNILLLAAILILLLVAITLGVVYRWPHVMPLCFPREVVTGTGSGTGTVVTEQQGLNCPTGSGEAVTPTSGDVLAVALLGLLGGALAAALSIRNLKGTTTAYDVPVALAWLKVPLGALTAILALVAIRADFVPGLSALDSQEQILAYALIFGFAQQLLTRFLDQQAQTLLEGLPGKDVGDEPPRPPPTGSALPTPPSAASPAPAAVAGPPRRTLRAFRRPLP